MENKFDVQVQIHDYDGWGRYVIVEEKRMTRDELFELKEKARQSVKLDWKNLPSEMRHVVYYAELLDKDGLVWFAGVYMHGEVYDDKDFERIFNAEDIGYVGAFHKR